MARMYYYFKQHYEAINVTLALQSPASAVPHWKVNANNDHKIKCVALELINLNNSSLFLSLLCSRNKQASPHSVLKERIPKRWREGNSAFFVRDKKEREEGERTNERAPGIYGQKIKFMTDIIPNCRIQLRRSFVNVVFALRKRCDYQLFFPKLWHIKWREFSGSRLFPKEEHIQTEMLRMYRKRGKQQQWVPMNWPELWWWWVSLFEREPDRQRSKISYPSLSTLLETKPTTGFAFRKCHILLLSW